ncbi:MAG: NAD(P) transhydrogenase subunit alpha [Thermogutta sp.]|nr:NAD(P) transhydrogenase subunit alpha [Thermogutta sp.]HOP75982.1 NAD(P) transhydrogenase subunit alpha [Thermogutta sp.]HPU06981.1 NAD(P) transhydrogenase subunit alpha [Thermogutta sp.]HPZ84107.1 NAD(P) transhydrogenase subunit alpha [Thermogutta sp.]HQF14030.1 NAD(P) transhydrogenase subunit alpha [Thermogutta sp.]
MLNNCFLLAEQINEVAEVTQGSQLPLALALTIFVLAIFVGFEIITKVPPTLHTPLMSGSNAISGITIVGAIIAAGAGHSGLATLLGTIAVVLATINVVGGFLVTNRMLHMFKRKS